MKKAISILFSVHYFALTVGFAISVHYCQGEVESINITSDRTCCCGGMEAMANCCSDSEIEIQLDIDQFFSPSINSQFENSLALLPSIDQNKIQAFEFADNEESIFLDLPPPTKQSTRLLNCSLTYYG